MIIIRLLIIRKFTMVFSFIIKAKMSSGKKQHFVPNSYLRQWEFKENRLYIFDLVTQKLHVGDPANICTENHFYTLDYLGEDRRLIDDYLSEIERDGLPRLKEMVRKEDLSQNGRDQAGWFMAAQKIRTPTQKREDEQISFELTKNIIREKIEDPIALRDIVKDLCEKFPDRDVMAEIGDDPKAYFLEQHRKIESDEIAFQMQNHKEKWLSTIPKMMEKVALEYIAGSWFVLQAPRNRGFITSDNPVVTFSFLDNHSMPTKKNVIDVDVTFPLSPHALVLLRYDRGRRIVHMEHSESGKSINELNMRTAMHAERYLFSHNKELLLATVGRYYDAWKTMRAHNSAKAHATNHIPVVDLQKRYLAKMIYRNYGA